MANYDAGDIAITALTVAGNLLIKLRDKGLISNEDVDGILRQASADIHPGREKAIAQLLEEVFNFK